MNGGDIDVMEIVSMSANVIVDCDDLKHLIKNSSIDEIIYKSQKLGYNLYDVFKWACILGRCDIVDWLYYNAPNVDIHKDSNVAFLRACYHNHLIIVQWFLSRNDGLIHNEIVCNIGFIEACEGGALNVAKWFVHNIPNINIRYNKDDAFVLACDNDRYKVVEWLCRLCEDYSYNMTWKMIDGVDRDVIEPIIFVSDEEMSIRNMIKSMEAINI